MRERKQYYSAESWLPSDECNPAGSMDGDTMNIKEAIENEASECAASADNMRNAPQHRDIFWVVSIILKGIAEKLDDANEAKPRRVTVAKRKVTR